MQQDIVRIFRSLMLFLQSDSIEIRVLATRYEEMNENGSAVKKHLIALKAKEVLKELAVLVGIGRLRYEVSKSAE